MKYHVVVICRATKDVVKTITEEPKSERVAQRIEEGVNINLNHDEYYADLVEVDECKYYLVGIDGTKTPDPRYWFDRWEVVQAKSIQDAKDVWAKRREGWLSDSEKPHVKVWAESDEFFSDQAWMRENVKWLEKYIAEILVTPIG